MEIRCPKLPIMVLYNVDSLQGTQCNVIDGCLLTVTITSQSTCILESCSYLGSGNSNYTHEYLVVAFFFFYVCLYSNILTSFLLSYYVINFDLLLLCQFTPCFHCSFSATSVHLQGKSKSFYLRSFLCTYNRVQF